MEQIVGAGKCGCLYCKGLGAPSGRDGWLRLKNRHGETYGRGNGKPRSRHARTTKR